MRFLCWTPAIVLGTLIFWSSDQSNPPGSDLSPDYVMHFFGFGIFSVAIAVGITTGFQLRLTFRRALVAFLIAFLYGCLDEYHQSFVPGRTATASDVLADSLGVIVFLAFTCLVLLSRNRRLES